MGSYIKTAHFYVTNRALRKMHLVKADYKRKDLARI